MSLYTIEQNLLRIFADIEDNDGEITEEQFKELELTKENFKTKLGKYVEAINTWKGEIESVDTEVKRLGVNKKVKVNRIERLKKAMLEALLMFGEDGKTNKFVELPAVKLFTKSTPVTITDDHRINLLVAEFARFASELVSSGVLYTGQDVDLQGVLDSINANLKAAHDIHDVETTGLDSSTEFKPYTLNDLITTTIVITNTHTIYELFRTGRSAIELISNDPFATTIAAKIVKDDWKTAIEMAEIFNAEGGDKKVSIPTVARLDKTQSLIIR